MSLVVSSGNYYFNTLAIVASASGAAYVGDISDLHDGMPATPCAMTWCSGAQTTASYVIIPFSVANYGPEPLAGIRFFGLLNCSANLNGAEVKLLRDVGPTMATATIITYAQIRKLPNGQYGCFVLLDESLARTEQFYGWQIFNHDADNGGTLLAASADFSVGEIFAFPAVNLDATDLSCRWESTSKRNRTSANSAAAVMRDPFRIVRATLASESFDATFLGDPGTDPLYVGAIGTDPPYWPGENSANRFIRDLSCRPYIAIVMQDRIRGTDEPNPSHVRETGMLCFLADAGEHQANAAKNKWGSTLAFEEIM